jgi:hypothetical protein
MNFRLRALSDAQFDRIATDPQWRHWVLGQTWPDVAARENMLEVFRQINLPADDLAAFAARPVGSPPSELAPALALDKAWHAIHFLLAGSDWECTPDPATHAILGGDPIDERDLGYGPAKVLDAAAVVQIARALHEIAPEKLAARFDPAALAAAGIYPTKIAGDDTAREWVVDGYRQLRDAYNAAAASQQRVILWIT